MLRRLGTWLREHGSAFAINLRSRDLRRAQISFGIGWATEWAFTVALSIVAFRDGGAAAVGAVALLRLLPSAVTGPFGATLADRFRREVILSWIGLVRAVTIGAAALVVTLDLPPAYVYVLAVGSTIAATPFRAAHSALLPSLCATSEELTSANVVRGMLDSLSVLLGPLLAAALLAFAGPASVFAVGAGASLVSAVLVTGLRYEAPPRRTAPAGSLVRAAGDGLRAAVSSQEVALLIGLGVAQTFMRGCLMVFSVVVAIELLDTGDSGVGLLNAAVGAGAVAGSVSATLLVGSQHLGQWFGVSVILWGAPFALIGVFPSEPLVLALLGCVGVGNALLDVSFFSLMGRLVADEVLARVYGVLESLIAVAVGLGAMITPVVIDAAGIEGALIALGSVCPLLAAVYWPRLRALDRRIAIRERDIVLLREVPMLGTLPVVTIEQLARSLRRLTAAAGEVLCEQGRPADAFYVIGGGAAEVIRDGTLISTLGPGDYFGEIGLLRDIPRSATVRARTALYVAELPRDLFVPIVNGYSASAREADTVIEARIAGLRPLGSAA